MRFQISSYLTLATVIISFLTSEVAAFTRIPINRISSSTKIKGLDNDAILKLDEMKLSYERVSETEKAPMQDVIEKYATYREIRAMMSKLKQMYKSEASETRKAKQLKSFIALYKGRIELEEVLKEKIGFASKKPSMEMNELSAIEKWDAEILALENKLKNVAMAIPEGKSTRMERFGY